MALSQNHFKNPSYKSSHKCTFSNNDMLQVKHRKKWLITQTKPYNMRLLWTQTQNTINILQEQWTTWWSNPLMANHQSKSNELHKLKLLSKNNPIKNYLNLEERF